MDECEVRKAVLSFPAGSAGGLDGLRPQHIRDLLMCREAGPEFLSVLTAFVNLYYSFGWWLSFGYRTSFSLVGASWR